MINASKELLNSFFSNNLQYVVPFFQRAYVWDEDNWEILWEHITTVAEKISNNEQNEHFIGTIITKQRTNNNIGENKLDLIDGQQRLTTFSLLLKAIENKASWEGVYTGLKDLASRCVVFRNAKNEMFPRIEHSRIDGAYFRAIMFDENLSKLENQSNKLLMWYRYFLSKLEGYRDEELNTLMEVALKNIPIISMSLSAEDDEQEIFDTINSLGVRLTTGELLKNYIFSDETVIKEYANLWGELFEEDEDDVLFWNKTKTSGRIMRTNMEVLLYCYLIIQKKTAVQIEKLFGEFKHWLHNKDSQEKIIFLQELKNYASIYANFPEWTYLNEIGFSQEEERFFHLTENLWITTVYPLVLFIYNQVKDKNTRITLLRILESYLVRRNICRITPKNYNNLFIQIISKLIELGWVSPDNLNTILMGFTEDTNRFPPDLEFKNAFSTEPISNANAREILFHISLFKIHDPQNDVRKLSSSSYSTEHMMPQKWETNWNDPGMNDIEKHERNKKLKTLGNLTLVTKSLNSHMKNSAWEEKKIALKEHSFLNITTDYIDNDFWNEEKIDQRANDLAEVALQIWK